MDYETVLEEQLEATELSELEDSLADAAQQSGVLEELSVEDLVHRLLNGQQILDSDQILENLKNLFLLEVRSSLMLGCEILAVCILIGYSFIFNVAFCRSNIDIWRTFSTWNLNRRFPVPLPPESLSADRSYSRQ